MALPVSQEPRRNISRKARTRVASRYSGEDVFLYDSPSISKVSDIATADPDNAPHPRDRSQTGDTKQIRAASSIMANQSKLRRADVRLEATSPERPRMTVQCYPWPEYYKMNEELNPTGPTEEDRQRAWKQNRDGEDAEAEKLWIKDGLIPEGGWYQLPSYAKNWEIACHYVLRAKRAFRQKKTWQEYETEEHKDAHAGPLVLYHDPNDQEEVKTVAIFSDTLPDPAHRWTVFELVKEQLCEDIWRMQYFQPARYDSGLASESPSKGGHADIPAVAGPPVVVPSAGDAPSKPVHYESDRGDWIQPVYATDKGLTLPVPVGVQSKDWETKESGASTVNSIEDPKFEQDPVRRVANAFDQQVTPEPREALNNAAGDAQGRKRGRQTGDVGREMEPKPCWRNINPILMLEIVDCVWNTSLKASVKDKPEAPNGLALVESTFKLTAADVKWTIHIMALVDAAEGNEEWLEQWKHGNFGHWHKRLYWERPNPRHHHLPVPCGNETLYLYGKIFWSDPESHDLERASSFMRQHCKEGVVRNVLLNAWTVHNDGHLSYYRRRRGKVSHGLPTLDSPQARKRNRHCKAGCCKKTKLNDGLASGRQEQESVEEAGDSDSEA